MSSRRHPKHLLLGVSMLALAATLVAPVVSSAQVVPPIVALRTDLSVAAGEDPTAPNLVLDAGARWEAGILFRVAASPLDAARFPEGCVAHITVTRGNEILLDRASDLVLCGADTQLDFKQKPTALMLQVDDHVDVVLTCTGADGMTHMTELSGDL